MAYNTFKVSAPDGRELGTVTVRCRRASSGQIVAVAAGGRLILRKIYFERGKFVRLESLLTGVAALRYRRRDVYVLGEVVEMRDAPRVDEDGSGRIAELRDRLRELKDEGEAHNESAQFRLEREIYDLEHADTTSAEGWPEYIGEEGGQP